MVSYYLYIFKCVYHVHCHFYKPKLFSGMVAADNIEHVAQVPKPVTTARSGRIGGTCRRTTRARAKATTRAGALGTAMGKATMLHLQAVASRMSQCLCSLFGFLLFSAQIRLSAWLWRLYFGTVFHVCVCVCVHNVFWQWDIANLRKSWQIPLASWWIMFARSRMRHWEVIQGIYVVL